MASSLFDLSGGCPVHGGGQPFGQCTCEARARAARVVSMQARLAPQAASDAARDEALERVEENADAQWKKDAYAAVLLLAREFETFTTDDVWRRGLRKPREPRALGAIMVHCKRRNLVAPTDRMVNSTQRSRHSAPIRVWRSLIYKRNSNV